MMEALQGIIARNHKNTVFHALGMVIDKLDADETIVSLTIDERHLQHVGLVHGGIYVLMAESAASLAAACTLTDASSSVVALEINANHVHKTSQGKLFAHARAIHQGNRILVYEVRVVDADNTLLSMARCTLMKSREHPSP